MTRRFVQVQHMDLIEESTLKKMRLDVMTNFVSDMVRDTLDSFVRGDASQAKSVCDLDDEVDGINLYLIKNWEKRMDSASLQVSELIC